MIQIRSAIGLVVAAILIVSCTTAATPSTPTAPPETASPSPIATRTTTADATPTAVPSRPPTASPTTVPAAQTAPQGAGPKVELAPTGILTKVAASRGLQIKGEVPFATLSRDELRPYLVKMLEKEHGKEEIEKTKALWVSLDLIGEKDDLYGLYVGLLDEQIAGFYELDNHAMKLIGGGRTISTKDEIVLAHEYVHALQDQNFDIGARVKQVKNDGEKSLALQALMEGDATLAMAEYARKNLSAQALASLQNESSSLDMQKLQSAPLALQVSMLFPYQQGTNFVASLFRTGGWGAVNKALINPPVTAEQIIHPEKYIAGEGSKPVDLPDIAPALGQQWSRFDSGTIGELGWLVYFAKGLTPNDAAPAAAGWGGDKYVIFRNSLGKQAMAVLSDWDTEQDAEEFFAALRDLQDSQAKTEYTLDEDVRFEWTRPLTSGYASIKGQQVLLVIAPDKDTGKKIAGRFTGF